jgi:hypothetical protein
MKHELISGLKQMVRSGFKTSDQLRNQGAGFRKNAAYQAYVSILRKTATQISELRWGFEMAYRQDHRSMP